MSEKSRPIDIVLVADKKGRAEMLRDELEAAGVTGNIRRLEPAGGAVDCARQGGRYKHRPLPDLFMFDYSQPDEYKTTILNKIAFGSEKTKAPVVLLTSPDSTESLQAGEVDDGEAIMFWPTRLESFCKKLEPQNQNHLLKALRTLYEFGPILLKTPENVLREDARELAAAN